MPLNKRVKRILWIVAAIALAIPILVAIIILARLDAFVRTGVEIGGTKVLGVKTRLQSASVSLLRGRIALKGLNVGNPEGFQSESFVRASLIRVEAQLGALRKKEIHLKEVILDGPEFTYERAHGKTNIAVIMDRLKSKKPPEEEPSKPEEKGEPAKLKIDLLRVTNAKVHVVMLGREMDVSLPDIKLTNLADKDGNAIPANEILSALLGKMVAPIEQAAAGLMKEAKKVGEALGKEFKGAGETLTEEGKKLGGEVQKLFRR